MSAQTDAANANQTTIEATNDNADADGTATASAAATATAASSPTPPPNRSPHARTPSRIPVPVHARAGSGQAALTSAAVAAVPPAAAVTAPVSARTKPAATAARTAASAARTKRPEVAAASSAASSSAAASSAAAPIPASSPPAAATSASARHAAYLAGLVAARAAREREERRRKPAIKDRLTSTFTMSAQKHALGADTSAAGAAGSSSSAAPLDRLSAAKDAEYAALLPRVFSMLGGNSIDCLRRAFTDAGWVENPSERSRVWSIQWSIVGRVIDYSSLLPHQIVNHFERAHAITSKVGLCSSIHLVRNYDAAASDFFPRCFEVHKHEAESLRELRTAWLDGVCLNYAGRFLRSYQREHTGDAEAAEAESVTGAADDEEDESSLPLSPLSVFDPTLVQLSFIAFQALLRRRRFEVDGLDNALPVLPAKGPPVQGVDYAQLSEQEWTKLETEVERLEQIDRDTDAVRQRARRKAEAVAATESKSNDNAGAASSPQESSPDALIDADEAQAQEAQQDDQLDAELESFEEAAAASSPLQEESSPSASPSPPLAAADEAASSSSPSESESPSLARLSLLSRSPLLSYSVLASHLCSLFRELASCDPQHFSLVAPHTRNLWILKPGGLSRGRGIEVHASYSSILATLQKGGTFVAQQYIERPLLVRRKKFDLRQWVLVTNFASVLCTWFYRAGCYLRFSSKDYTPFVVGGSASSIHLTNNSIQKHEADFDSLEWAPGNMWSSDQFCTHLDSILPSIHARLPETRGLASGSAVWLNHIQPSMMRIARLTIAAGFQDSLEPRPNSFSLYGFDYMISADLRPWLIEVNSSPTLVGIAVPGIVAAMSRDLVSIVTQDAYSPASPLWREKIEAEKARLAGLAEEERQARESEAEEKQQQMPPTTKGAGVAGPAAGKRSSAAKPSFDSNRSVARAGSVSASSSCAVSSACGSASASSSLASASAFVLPLPPPLGHRVGGFEVVSSLYIGSVPRAQRTAPALGATGGEDKSATAASTATPTLHGASNKTAGSAAPDREKKAPTQSTGLVVAGKTIPNPAVAAAAFAAMAAGPASKLARAGSSSTLRRNHSATTAGTVSNANSKAKTRS